MRRLKVHVLVTASALFALAAAAPTQRDVSGEGVVSGSVNGVPVRFRIEPGAAAMPALTRETATRAGLRPGWFGVEMRIGPTRLDGHTAVARLVLSGMELKHRVVWFDQSYATPIDGVVGPGGLRERVVRFQLRVADPGERTAVLPLVSSRWGPSVARLQLPDGPITVRFDPHVPRSTATAGAAVRIAAQFGGALAGPPSGTPIIFGITRPVRTMRLSRPLPIGPLQVDVLAARVADYGSTAGIADRDADPDEVVVVGGRRGKEDDRIVLGADWLARCSAIVFDGSARSIRLSCK